MAILPIYTYDHSVLREPATPVKDITGEVAAFVESMVATMHNADGIGLAANQVGDSRAITTIDVSELEDCAGLPLMVLINPVITAQSEETVEYEEGCLSLPTLRDKVVRPKSIQLRFYDLQQHEHSLEIDGFLARVIQHEVDHLSGKYFFEYLNPMRRAMAHPKLRRIQLGQVVTSYPLYDPRKHSAHKQSLKKLAHKRGK
jgi:peptide deformylase